jgi:hypothetical protein
MFFYDWGECPRCGKNHAFMNCPYPELGIGREEKREMEPLPCAGKSRDDEPCSGEPMERQSLGIYAGRWCRSHWKTSGYRDEPASAFDPADAGETYGDEDL